MTNTTIFAITALTTIIILGASNALAADHGDGSGDGLAPAKAIPDWVDNNFRWYGEGLIEQTDLLNSLSYLLDNGNIHLSDKAAQEMHDLRGENAALKKKLDGDDKMELGVNIIEKASDSPVDEYGRVKVQFHWDEETEQEALHHLRKAYDLDPAFQTKVVQFDSNHDKWIDVLSIDWGSSSSQDCSAAEGGSDENSSCWIRVSQAHAGEEIWTDEYGRTSSSGDPDRPLITGQVYNSETTDDSQTREEALHHLRKAYDLNPNFEAKVVQYDKDHKDWIIIESWSWGESTAGGEYDVQYKESDLNFVNRLNSDQDEHGIIIVNNLEGLEEQGIIITGGLTGTEEQGIIITGGLTDFEKNGIIVVDNLTDLEKYGIVIVETQPTSTRY